MTKPVYPERDVLSFGPFRLIANERLLLKGEIPTELGARSFDILAILVNRPHVVVAKRELMASVWSDVTVEEGSLRFHIAALRKVLGDGKDGARYIATAAGRGYCFVAPVTRSSKPDDVSAIPLTTVPYANLPNALTRMIGRDDTVRELATTLRAARFITIVGAGGVGKTTVAVSVGHDLLDAFAGSVLFVDLGALRDPALMPSMLASMLGIAIQSEDPTPSLVAFLRDRRMLLIFDTCEHVIESVAPLSARLYSEAPELHILATSRETLRVEGERVHRLQSLAVPPEDTSLGAEGLLAFPATQLFTERAAAGGVRLELDDVGAMLVSSICRRLDGLPLAIELAAGRVEAYGLAAIAAFLEQRLNLLWQGQRTAPPRQQTLQATLDWSFELLSDVEQVVLRRLAVFAGHFTIEAALAIVPSAAIEPELLISAFDSLVAKSMVAARPIGAMMRYRLLDATRARALVIGIDDDEFADLAAQHAMYYRRWLEQTGADWPTFSDAAERAPHLAVLGNVRVALDWCFGAHGDSGIGIGLAAAAAPVFLALSLLTECHRWSECALSALDDAMCGSREEMILQAALGMALMFTHGENETARVALDRSLAVARTRGEILDQVQLLGPLHMFHTRIGEFNTALQHARQSVALASTVEDPAPTTLAHALLGIALHLTGNLEQARTELEAALPQRSIARRTRSLYLGFDHQNWASIALARTLWLQGLPAQAIQRARQAVEDAAGMDHPVTLSIALNWAISVFFWTGNLQDAADYIRRFTSHAAAHSMGPYLVVGRGFQAEMAIRQGTPRLGIAAMRESLEELHAAQYALLTTPFNIALIQGLEADGQHAAALKLLDENIARVKQSGDLCYLPELLRLQGRTFVSLPGKDARAQECFTQSIDLSRLQTALSWELRATLDQAALWARQGRQSAARMLLRPVFDRFAEGQDTADLVLARQQLAELGEP